MRYRWPQGQCDLEAEREASLRRQRARETKGHTTRGKPVDWHKNGLPIGKKFRRDRLDLPPEYLPPLDDTVLR